MPNLDNMEIPRPKNWQDFEILMESYARINWPGCIIALFGGAGQEQHGVDIYVRDKKSNYIGIQCKKVARLTLSQIEKEIEKAKHFKPALKHYIIAVSTARNARIQEQINSISSRHNEDGLFSVEIIFWEDIIRLIVTDKKIFEQHYPQLLQGAEKGNDFTIQANNIENSVIGNKITINTYKTLKIKESIQDTIGSNTYMKNYVKHLIDRYHEYKKAEFNSKTDKMNYSLIYVAIKRVTRFKWDEIPCDQFADICLYLQKRIDNTILGKRNKKSEIKNYSTFDEYFNRNQKD